MGYDVRVAEIMMIIDEFPHSYIFDVAPEWRMKGEDVVVCESQHLLGMHTQDFQEIRFYPETGASWVAQFERGERGKAFAHTVLTTPDASQACVISSGAGYWVNVESRKVNALQSLPITQALAIQKREIILLITWRDILAYRAGNVVWSLRNLVSDRLRVTAVNEDNLNVIGFDGDNQSLTVDLRTGLLLK
jgi:hypothetical protein